MWVCSESSGNEREDREDQNPSSICEILRRIQPNLMGELTLGMMNRRRSPIRRKTMALLVLGPCDSDRRDGNHSSRLLPLTSSLSSVSAATATSRHCSSKANPRQPHPPNRTSPKGLHYCEPEYCHSGAVLLLQPSRVADCFIAGGHRDHHRVHKEKEHLGLPIVPVASRQNAVVVVFPKPPCLELVTGHLPSAFIDVLPLVRFASFL